MYRRWTMSLLMQSIFICFDIGLQDLSRPLHKPNFFNIMIAVVEIGGKQYTVENNTSFVVDRQHVEVGKTIEVPAMLIADDKSTKIGTPTIDGSKVTLKVEEHFKGDKIRVFKIKSKKRYMRTQGFRPYQTRLTVTAIA